VISVGITASAIRFYWTSWNIWQLIQLPCPTKQRLYAQYAPVANRTG
jgi:hypothetical protein